MTAPIGFAADEVKTCSGVKGCGQTKPASAFYMVKGKWLRSICRDCDNARERTQTLARIIRNRARNRAYAELAKRYPDEFTNLLDHFTDAAQWEAALIDEADRASHESGGIPRLRPGQRREGQGAENRINRMWAEVGKCRDCSHHHNHGHTCENCGHPPTLPEEASKQDQLAYLLPEDRGTCSCPHPTRRHSEDDGCLIEGCECSGYPETGAA